MGYEITPMLIDDYDEALALWLCTEGIGLDLEDADSRANTEAYLRRNPGLSFVARNDGRLIGAVLCGHDGRRGYLHHLAVDESCRRQGIGGTLVAHCLTALHAEGIARCNIFVFAENDAGRQFWERQGWRSYSTVTLMQKQTKQMGEIRLIEMSGQSEKGR